jgi:hypothetical protein
MEWDSEDVDEVASFGLESMLTLQYRVLLVSTNCSQTLIL